MENILSTIAGWIGMSLILAAYYLVSTRKVAGESNLYQSLNFVGAFCLIYNTFVQQAWPVMVLNIVWVMIAIKTLFMKKKR
jgi:uncharacterized membrane protein HdeD (DUF308 family)